MKMLITSEINLTTKSWLQEHQLMFDVIPFIKIEPINSEHWHAELDVTKGNSLILILTSKYAVEAFHDAVKDRAFDYKFIAIEGATSKLIKTYWRSNSVLFKGKYVSEIIDFLKRNTFTEQLFFLCGNESLPDLPNYLTARKDIKWKQIQVYSNTATPQVLNINYKAILFFSPSAIKSYQIQNQFDQDTIYGCIGTTTAAYLQSVYKEAKIIMPPHPDKLELCKTIFKLMYNK